MQRQLLAHVGRPRLAAGADDDDAEEEEEEEEEDDEGAGGGRDQGGDSGSGSESAGEDSGADPDAAQPAGAAANETGVGEGAAAAAAAPGRTASDVTVAGGAPVFMSAVLETLVRVCRARSNSVTHTRLRAQTKDILKIVGNVAKSTRGGENPLIGAGLPRCPLAALRAGPHRAPHRRRTHPAVLRRKPGSSKPHARRFAATRPQASSARCRSAGVAPAGRAKVRRVPTASSGRPPLDGAGDAQTPLRRAGGPRRHLRRQPLHWQE
jgi:hypothetical protein